MCVNVCKRLSRTNIPKRKKAKTTGHYLPSCEAPKCRLYGCNEFNRRHCADSNTNKSDASGYVVNVICWEKCIFVILAIIIWDSFREKEPSLNTYTFMYFYDVMHVNTYPSFEW